MSAYSYNNRPPTLFLGKGVFSVLLCLTQQHQRLDHIYYMWPMSEEYGRHLSTTIPKKDALELYVMYIIGLTNYSVQQTLHY